MKKNKKIGKAIKNFYSFKNYRPTKNSVSVVYNGTTYLSKAQCMALEGITRKELDDYLKSEDKDDDWIDDLLDVQIEANH